VRKSLKQGWRVNMVSISTKKSRDLIHRNNKAEKNGEIIDWDKVFIEVKELEKNARYGM
jgi:hypothetical protein